MTNILNNDNLEQELNTTRIKLYEQTKNMTTQERADFFNKKGQKVLTQHRIKIKAI